MAGRRRAEGIPLDDAVLGVRLAVPEPMIAVKASPDTTAAVTRAAAIIVLLIEILSVARRLMSGSPRWARPMPDGPRIVQGKITFLFLCESTRHRRGSKRRVVTTAMSRMLSGVEWPGSEGLGSRSGQPDRGVADHRPRPDSADRCTFAGKFVATMPSGWPAQMTMGAPVTRSQSPRPRNSTAPTADCTGFPFRKPSAPQATKSVKISDEPTVLAPCCRYLALTP